MHRIPPNQLHMHPFFMLDRELRQGRFEEVDFERENRRARKAVIHAGAWLVCLFTGMGIVAHFYSASRPAAARADG